MDPKFDLSAYHYDLPKELIASHPLPKRDDSRLMVIQRATGLIREMRFYELADFLKEGDQLILNDSRVIKARMIGAKPSGAKIEIFLIKELNATQWEVMAKPGRKLKAGDEVVFGPDFSCIVNDTLSTGHKSVRFVHSGDLHAMFDTYGEMPLPHYMERGADASDEERYQTVYSENPGSLAAPTAGLHFTPELLTALENRGVEKHAVTLHVGLGTFKPVQTEDIRDHKMHSESFTLSEEVADAVNHPKGLQICVGTTTCRVLETCANEKGRLTPGMGETDVYLYPGVKFKFVKGLLTNFHLPGSSLIMLVAAFGGHELIMEAYQKAVKDKFRFYSYGDAMLIL